MRIEIKMKNKIKIKVEIKKLGNRKFKWSLKHLYSYSYIHSYTKHLFIHFVDPSARLHSFPFTSLFLQHRYTHTHTHTHAYHPLAPDVYYWFVGIDIHTRHYSGLDHCNSWVIYFAYQFATSTHICYEIYTFFQFACDCSIVVWNGYLVYFRATKG